MMTKAEAEKMIREDVRLHHDYLSGTYRKAIKMAIQALSETERNIGKWVYSNDFRKIETCSCCGESWGHIATWFNFCPSCGADMRGEKE